MVLVVTLIVAVGACGDSSGTADIGDVRDAIEDGDSCAEIIAVKNDMDPKDADREVVADELRAIGCYSVTSERIDR